MERDPVDRLEQAIIESTERIRSAFTNRGVVDDENPSGEQQLAADVAADELLAERFGAIDGIGSYASEERRSVLDIGEGLSVTVDPLDGSSNLGPNNPVGTIVAAYESTLPARGDDLVAAWFVLYGPLTTVVGTRGETVVESVVVDGAVVRERTVSIPSSPTIYGFGGRVPEWPSDFEAVANEIATELKLRYGGAMVADVNQVLTHGGIFAYPALSSAPQGKLRLQFEAIPMAAIVEAAGGASSDGRQSLLQVDPSDLHQRTPVHLGNEPLIDRIESALG